jgi:ADP-heptose:LPS heptosyltransferase
MKRIYKKIKSYLKRVRLSLGKILLDKAPSLAKSSNSLAHLKILFIRHDGKIGDYLVSSFVYREIKKQAPNAHIGVVVAKETQSLFNNNPYIDSLYVTKKRALLPFWTLGRRIAKEGYDVVIDLTEVLRNRDLVLIRAIKAPINIGYNKANFKLFTINIAPNNKHISYDYQQALIELGYKNIDCYCEIPSFSVSPALKHFCQTHLTKDDYVAINFFGAANHKKFSLENQLKWLTKLKNVFPNKKCLVLTYPQVSQQLRSQLPVNEFLMYDDTATIFDSIELMRNAFLVISPDTAIVHAAAALNKPLATFYMSDNPQQPYRKWFPAHFEQQVITIAYYQHNINEIDPDRITLPLMDSKMLSGL